MSAKERAIVDVLRTVMYGYNEGQDVPHMLDGVRELKKLLADYDGLPDDDDSIPNRLEVVVQQRMDLDKLEDIKYVSAWVTAMSFRPIR